jgi:anti-anti-sigma factor
MTTFGLYFDLRVNHAAREITVHGEFDATTAPCLATAVAHLQRVAVGDITIRLDDVTYMDAGGLAAIAAAQQRQIERGAHLRVWGANTDVRRLFVLGRLDDLLQTSQHSASDTQAARVDDAAQPHPHASSDRTMSQ